MIVIKNNNDSMTLILFYLPFFNLKPTCVQENWQSQLQRKLFIRIDYYARKFFGKCSRKIKGIVKLKNSSQMLRNNSRNNVYSKGWNVLVVDMKEKNKQIADILNKVSFIITIHRECHSKNMSCSSSWIFLSFIFFTIICNFHLLLGNYPKASGQMH